MRNYRLQLETARQILVCLAHQYGGKKMGFWPVAPPAGTWVERRIANDCQNRVMNVLSKAGHEHGNSPCRYNGRADVL
jgi:hypothetical protein